jgi:hypothetical protein
VEDAPGDYEIELLAAILRKEQMSIVRLGWTTCVLQAACDLAAKQYGIIQAELIDFALSILLDVEGGNVTGQQDGKLVVSHEAPVTWGSSGSGSVRARTVRFWSLEELQRVVMCLRYTVSSCLKSITWMNSKPRGDSVRIDSAGRAPPAHLRTRKKDQANAPCLQERT